jgi:hypothetical protein
MTQSRRGSLIEAIINVLIGFGINFTANALLFPLFGWHISASQNLTLGLIYTGISILRSYAITCRPLRQPHKPLQPSMTVVSRRLLSRSRLTSSLLTR